jgi:hypothetical protein
VLVHKDPLKPTIEILANVVTDDSTVLIRNVFKPNGVETAAGKHKFGCD